jgi:uncharacterized membrane protein
MNSDYLWGRAYQRGADPSQHPAVLSLLHGPLLLLAEGLVGSRLILILVERTNQWSLSLDKR